MYREEYVMPADEITRMQDVYVQLNEALDKIGAMDVTAPLVWVWMWNIVQDLWEDDEWANGSATLEDVFVDFWRSAGTIGLSFTLEYGVDSAQEKVLDWMQLRGFLLTPQHTEEA